jgi:hypothetical protein
MAFRGSEETLRARILELEEENASLRAELARLSGSTPLKDPGPAPVAIDRRMWWPGDSWLMGWDPPNALLAYTGEAGEDQYLRFLNVTKPKQSSDFLLAKGGAKCVARFDRGIVAPLADASLALFSWPGGAISERIALSSPLVAQPIEDQKGRMLAVTASRELLTIDPKQFVVTERRMVEASELQNLGFPDGDARQLHNGYKMDSDFQAPEGWSVAAIRKLPDRTLCALGRSFAGNDEVGACVVAKGAKKPVWWRHAGAGDFIYVYGIDQMLVLHNVSLEHPAKTWTFWQVNGAPVLEITGRGSDALLEVFDDDGAAVARCQV